MKRSKVEELIYKINTIKFLANDTKKGIQYYLDEADRNGKTAADASIRIASYGYNGEFNQTRMRENMKVLRRIALDVAKQIKDDQA